MSLARSGAPTLHPAAASVNTTTKPKRIEIITRSI
jgi:hypothetical protein